MSRRRERILHSFIRGSGGEPEHVPRGECPCPPRFEHAIPGRVFDQARLILIKVELVTPRAKKLGTRAPSPNSDCLAGNGVGRNNPSLDPPGQSAIIPHGHARVVVSRTTIPQATTRKGELRADSESQEG